MIKQNIFSKLKNKTINELIARLEFKEELKNSSYTIGTPNNVDEDFYYSDSVYLLDNQHHYFSNERDYCLNNDEIVYGLLKNNKINLNIMNPYDERLFYSAFVEFKNNEGKREIIETQSKCPNRAVLECILLLSQKQEINFPYFK